MPKRRSWSEKLRDSKDLPRVEKINGKMTRKWGSGTVVIPAPLEVDEIMKKIPKGKLITMGDIRTALAKKHGATISCPLTTGIFAWVAANAAEEEKEHGKRDITPYWRTLKKNGEINPKYPGGVQAQRLLLESEGHNIIQRGKKYIVENFERSLADISAFQIKSQRA